MREKNANQMAKGKRRMILRVNLPGKIMQFPSRSLFLLPAFAPCIPILLFPSPYLIHCFSIHSLLSLFFSFPRNKFSLPFSLFLPLSPHFLSIVTFSLVQSFPLIPFDTTTIPILLLLLKLKYSILCAFLFTLKTSLCHWVSVSKRERESAIRFQQKRTFPTNTSQRNPLSLPLSDNPGKSVFVKEANTTIGIEEECAENQAL